MHNDFEGKLNKTFQNSFIYKLYSCFDFLKIDNSSKYKNSMFLKNIDNIILFALAILLIFTLNTSSNLIGLTIIITFGLVIIKTLFLKVTDNKIDKTSITSVDVPIILYILFMGLSVCFSSYFFPALKGYIKVLIYFASYLTFSNIFKENPKRILYLLIFTVFLMSIEAFYSIYQYVIGVNPLATWQDTSNLNPEDIMTRVYGSLRNPNLLAGYLLSGFSISTGLFFISILKKNIKYILLSLISLVSILLAIIFTGSRGAYLAIGTMGIAMIMISGHLIWHDFKHIKWLKKTWISLISLGLVLFCLIVFNTPSLLHRIKSIFEFRTDSSNSFRFNVYASSLAMLKDNFLLGIGPGNQAFRLVYGLYMKTGFDALSSYNIFLEIAIESGIFGLISFLGIFFVSFIKSIKNFYKNISIENKILTGSLIVAIIGLTTQGMFDTVFFRPQIQVIFWMLISILAIITSAPEKTIFPKN